MDSKDAYQILAAHVCKTLPTDVNPRRAVLMAMFTCMPSDQPGRKEIGESLQHLDLHIIAQRNLPIVFEPESTTGADPCKQSSSPQQT